MKTEHKYAQVLRWIADGEQVQWQSSNGQWLDESAEGVLQEILSDKFIVDRYRIKPKTIMIGDVECEAPLMSPEIDKELWVFSVEEMDACLTYHDPYFSKSRNAADSGLFFASKEACLAAHNAITKLLTQSK